MPYVPGGMLSWIGRWLPSLAASPWMELLLPLVVLLLAPPSDPAGWSPCCFFLSFARFLAPFGMAEFEGAAPAGERAMEREGRRGEEEEERFVLLWREGISSFFVRFPHKRWIKFERDYFSPVGKYNICFTQVTVTHLHV